MPFEKPIEIIEDAKAFITYLLQHPDERIRDNLVKLEDTILQIAANVLEEDNTTITKEKAHNAINELEQRTTFVRNS